MEMLRPVKVCGLNGSRNCFCNMADQLKRPAGIEPTSIAAMTSAIVLPPELRPHQSARHSVGNT